MSKIAFASIGATGHVVSSLGIVEELVKRGHEVEYFVPDRYRTHIENVGARCTPYESLILASGTPRRLNGFAMGHIPQRVAQETVTAFPDILSKLDQLQPDLLVYDAFTFAAKFAAERLGIPAVRKNGSFALSEHLDYYQDTASGQLPGQMASPESLQAYNDIMTKFFTDHGLRHRTFTQLMCEPASLEIVLLSRAFHPHADLYGDNVLFVGLAASRSSRPAAHPAPDRGPYEHLIYVSLGTVFNFQPAFFYVCLEAFAGTNARVVMCVGDSFPSDYWVDVPNNIEIYPYVDQLDVLARSDVFVTHAGTGSVMESMDAGVPMVVVPQYPEQVVTAHRVEELKAGLYLARENVSINNLRNAVWQLLKDPTYRTRAQELGELGRRDGGTQRACDAIVEFLMRRNGTTQVTIDSHNPCRIE